MESHLSLSWTWEMMKQSQIYAIIIIIFIQKEKIEIRYIQYNKIYIWNPTRYIYDWINSYFVQLFFIIYLFSFIILLYYIYLHSFFVWWEIEQRNKIR